MKRLLFKILILILTLNHGLFLNIKSNENENFDLNFENLKAPDLSEVKVESVPEKKQKLKKINIIPRELKKTFNLPVIGKVDFDWFYNKSIEKTNIVLSQKTSLSLFNLTLKNTKLTTDLSNTTVSADAVISGKEYKIGPLKSEFIPTDKLIHLRFSSGKEIITLPLIGNLDLKINALNFIFDEKSGASVKIDGEIAGNKIQADVGFDGNYIIIGFNLKDLSLANFDKSLENTIFKDILLSGKFTAKMLVNKNAKDEKGNLLPAFDLVFDQVKANLEKLKNQLGPLDQLKLKDLTASGSIGSNRILKLDINLESGFNLQNILTLEKAGLLFEYKIGSKNKPKFELTGNAKANILDHEFPILLSSSFSKENGLEIKGNINTHEISESNLPKQLTDLINIKNAELSYSSKAKNLNIRSENTIAGLDLIIEFNASANLQKGINISATVAPQVKEYSPFKDVSGISDQLKKIKIHDLTLKSGVSYTSKNGFSGDLELSGKVSLGQVLGKSEDIVKSNPLLNTEVTAVSKISIGAKPVVVVDVALENIQGLGKLFPELFNNISPSKTYNVTNPQTGKTVKETASIDQQAKQGILDFLDLIKITNGRLVLSTANGIVINDKTYDKGLSIDAQLSIDFSNKNNTIVGLLSQIISMTGKNPGSLELTGNINPANLRDMNLEMALGTGNLEASLPSKRSEKFVTLKSGKFGLKLTGTPSIAIIAGFSVIPVQGATPIELESGLDFSLYKVGVYSSMKNVWTEPFGIKGFAFGNLAAQWTQSYDAIASAVASTALALTGVGIAATFGDWALAIFLPTDIGFSGETTFIKSGARERIKQQISGKVEQEFKEKLKEDRYKNLNKEQQENLKEQIFKELLYKRKCGSRGQNAGVGQSDDYICARVFLNIGKDFTKFGLDAAIENPITIVDFIDFIAQQMGQQVDLKQVLPLKLKQATLKFVPFGTEIGSIKAEQGLGASGFIEILGKEACFVMGIDWENGIVLKGKVPSVNIGELKFTGAHCQTNPDYMVACSSKEYEELKALKQNLNRNTCKKGEPTIAGELGLNKMPRFVISGDFKLGSVLKSATDIHLNFNNIKFKTTTQIGTKDCGMGLTIQSLGENIKVMDLINNINKFAQLGVSVDFESNINNCIKDQILKVSDIILNPLRKINDEIQNAKKDTEATIKNIEKQINDLREEEDKECGGNMPITEIRRKLESTKVFRDIASSFGINVLKGGNIFDDIKSLFNNLKPSCVISRVKLVGKEAELAFNKSKLVAAKFSDVNQIIFNAIQEAAKGSLNALSNLFEIQKVFWSGNLAQFGTGVINGVKVKYKINGNEKELNTATINLNDPIKSIHDIAVGIANEIKDNFELLFKKEQEKVRDVNKSLSEEEQKIAKEVMLKVEKIRKERQEELKNKQEEEKSKREEETKSKIEEYKKQEEEKSKREEEAKSKIEQIKKNRQKELKNKLEEAKRKRIESLKL